MVVRSTSRRAVIRVHEELEIWLTPPLDSYDFPGNGAHKKENGVWARMRFYR
jgi:hypothetical protein